MKTNLYGVMAEFDNPKSLIEVSKKVVEQGYQKFDSYTPYPVHGLPEASRFPKPILPALVFLGGLGGGLAGYLMQYYAAVIAYPLDIGGRPYHSWPAFVPVTFETTILGAALTAVIGMIALNGLPEPYHPVFNEPRFESASRNHFFICIEASDPKFDLENVKSLFQSFKPLGVYEVEP